jgi:hypothetical protein
VNRRRAGTVEAAVRRTLSVVTAEQAAAAAHVMAVLARELAAESHDEATPSGRRSRPSGRRDPSERAQRTPRSG